jgi:hypothetical protein
LISGNRIGAFINGVGGVSGSNVVLGNWIGVDSTGRAALPNSTDGVVLRGAEGNTIGGATAGAVNVISGNTRDGIALFGASLNNLIRNANIGIGPDPRDPRDYVLPVGNGGDGVYYAAAARNNKVSSSRIFNSGGKQINDLGKGNKRVDPTTSGGNGFGIDTGSPDDAPLLSSAEFVGETLVVAGTLQSTPVSSFTLEFFGNSQPNPSGLGEGEKYLGSASVLTDANGSATFSAQLAAVFGPFVSATATRDDADGYTSEFSADAPLGGLSGDAAVGGAVLPGSGDSGVPVQLVSADNGVVVASTVANGSYLFPNVTPGSYFLQFAAPAGYRFVDPYQGDDTVASHADPADGTTEVFTLAPGEVNPFLNVGLAPARSAGRSAPAPGVPGGALLAGAGSPADTPRQPTPPTLTAPHTEGGVAATRFDPEWLLALHKARPRAAAAAGALTATPEELLTA